MIHFITWYLIISILGWIAFPISYRILSSLADRGYTTSRILGLLIWSFFFWLFASLGIINNDIGGILVGLLVLVALSIWALNYIKLDSIIFWMKTNKRIVIIVEVLFFLAFVLWTVVRASNPEAVGTEKPMELAFINSILNSPTFPPIDPWLSGYSISYYYFGYVIVAMLSKFTATPGAIGFNLAIILIFALTAIGAYGLVFNLLNTRNNHDKHSSKP